MTHSKHKLYLCKLCDHKSNDMNNMKRHINTMHASSEMFRCDSCPFQSDQKSDLYAHQLNEHGLSVTTINSDEMRVIILKEEEV